MSGRQKSQHELDRDDEARLNWFLRAKGVALSLQELTEITGIRASRVLSALKRLIDDGIIRHDGPNLWRVFRHNCSKVASL